MINLDDIASRLDNGVMPPADIYALLGEAQNLGLSVDPAVADRVNRGYNDPRDAHYLFNALELEYSVMFGRPTGAQAFAKRQALEQAADADAQAKRAAQAQIQAAQDAQSQAAKLAVAQSVSQQQLTAAQARAAVDKFKADTAASQALLDDRKSKALQIKEVLDAATT